MEIGFGMPVLFDKVRSWVGAGFTLNEAIDKVAEDCELRSEAIFQIREYFTQDIDPTPWCSGCGAMRKTDCHCGPLADNE